MRVVAVIHARMTSRRLPGKVMADFAGRPLIGQVVSSVRAATGLDQIVLAVSDEPSDDPLVRFAEQSGVACSRGNLNDVAKRVIDAGTACGADGIVRVCGDSPLLDPEIITAGVALFRSLRPDLVSNVLPRTFPKGQSVEVIKLDTLRREWDHGMNAEEQEHVTLRFHAQCERFEIVRMIKTPASDQLQLSVDTPDELVRLSRLAERLGISERRPTLADLIQESALTGHE